jgi:NUMOD3 motif
MAYVYRHIRLDTNKVFYVGIGNDLKYQRSKSKYNRNKHWHNVVNKTSIRVDILFDEIDYEEAKNKEIEFISLYGRRDFGIGTLVNMTDGGDGSLGMVVTDDVKSRISQKNKGKKVSQETRNKISLARKGFKHTEEVKKKIGEFKKGKKLPPRQPISEETRKKMSDGKKGKSPSYNYIRTAEHRKRLSEGALGKKMSDACRLKMSENRSIPIVQYCKDGELIKEWNSAKLAAFELFGSKNSSSIVRCLKNRQDLAYGYKWKYLNKH